MPTDIENLNSNSKSLKSISNDNIANKENISRIELSKINLPKHVAIIMDGNGRWANSRGKTRAEGHKAGVLAAKNIIDETIKLGIPYLTLYVFSSENWKRPKSEVSELMRLLKSFINEDILWLQNRKICLKVIGSNEGLDTKVVKPIERACKLTQNNTSLNLIVALNYGGRGEIVRGIKRFSQKLLNGDIDLDNIDEESFKSHLDLPDICDPDLLIRTSGEKRISNFLIWQVAYSELLFVDTLWPDFDSGEYRKAMYEYHLRERRFGSLSQEQSTAAE